MGTDIEATPPKPIFSNLQYENRCVVAVLVKIAINRLSTCRKGRQRLRYQISCPSRSFMLPTPFGMLNLYLVPGSPDFDVFATCAIGGVNNLGIRTTAHQFQVLFSLAIHERDGDSENVANFVVTVAWAYRRPHYRIGALTRFTRRVGSVGGDRP
jgi:hypothetical protein